MCIRDSAKRELRQQAPTETPLDPVAAYLARHGQAAAVPASVEDVVFQSAPGPQRGRDGRIEGSEPAAAATEDSPSPSRSGGPATLRVNVDTIEHLMTMVSELSLIHI